MADAPYNAVDLSRLVAPSLIDDHDFDQIMADAVARMQQEMPDFVPHAADPVTKTLRVMSIISQLQRQRVNDAAQAVMPAYATGSDLDHIAALFGVARFELIPANPLENTAAVMESDADFRRRMVLAPEGYSVAGPEGAYIFHALSADADVMDASAISPAPGEVLVSVLSRTGDGSASPALVAAVDAYVSDETRRPLTDFVTVQSAAIIPYSIIAQITTFSGPDAAVVLASARANLDAYVLESHRLGRHITISGLHAALHVEGVQNVALTSPAADIAISRVQAPYCTGITLNHAGTDG